MQRRLLESAGRSTICRRSFAGQRFYATEKKGEERETFKGQLYQSTHERVQREKEEQARFAAQRENQKAASSSGAWFIPVGRH